jgi:hypothetical protein
VSGIDAGRSERAAPVTMSATALAATSVRSFVALATWSPASFAASRALVTCGLSDLLTRAAAAALAAATSALAKISRPRSELTRLSSAFVSVLGTVIPITLVGAEALVLAALVFVARFFEGGALAARPFDVVERVFAERVLAAFAIRVILLRLIVPHPGRHRVKWRLREKFQEGLIVRCQIVVALFLLLAWGTDASSECAEARDHYLSAVDGVREYLGRYVQCITTSNGLEDCSSEFRRLSNAHTEFEKAVEEFRADCP